MLSIVMRVRCESYENIEGSSSKPPRGCWILERPRG